MSMRSKLPVMASKPVDDDVEFVLASLVFMPLGVMRLIGVSVMSTSRTLGY